MEVELAELEPTVNAGVDTDSEDDQILDFDLDDKENDKRDSKRPHSGVDTDSEDDQRLDFDLDDKENDKKDSKRPHSICKEPQFTRGYNLLAIHEKPFLREILHYEMPAALEITINSKPLKAKLLEQDIQSNSELNRDLSYYKYFNSYAVSKAYEEEKNAIGLRVVRPYLPNETLSNVGVLGTIIDVKNTGHVSVQWDNHDTATNVALSDDKEQCNLLLFNNEHTGVKHENIQCDACLEYPLRGIRWKCLTCGDYDLCTQCYMGSRHNLTHEFMRFICMNSKGVNFQSRRQKVYKSEADLVKKIVKRNGEGILQNATVQLRNGSTSQDMYVELISSEKGKVKVKNGGEHSILEIKLQSGGKFSFYPDHLPELKNCRSNFHFEFDVAKQDDKSKHNKAVVHVWRSIQEKEKEKPCLYLIFANAEENKSVDEFAIMNEVAQFAKDTKLPCHVLGQKVLFHSGSTNTVCIHYKTCPDTTKELIEKGFNEFERGETVIDGKDEDEIDYFKKMAEHVTGEKMLPVIIYFSGITEVSKNKTVLSSKIPIFQIKRKQRNTLGVSVFWCVTGDNNKFELLQKYETDIIKPWCVKQSKFKKNEIPQDQRSDEYLLPSEIPFGLDALVCNCLIGVCMAEDQHKERNDMKHNNDHYTALSVYLLINEKWRIPNRHRKPHIKKPLDQRSLEYIYKQVVTSEMIHNLWYNQKSFVEMKYEPSEYLEDDEDSCGRYFNKDVLNTKGIKLKKWESECYGFIFFALLQKRLWSGATQLVETGHIGIHHILFGCVILDVEISSWRTTTVLKEKLERLKSAFTERAIRITSCIDDADKKIENTEIEATEGNKKDPQERYIINETEEEEQQQGDNINHAARLLLNHGYLKDAIVTKNNTYVKCQTVNNILNEMWYGTERINGQTIFGLIVLAAVHLFVLPLLMINMEARPLSWFYKKYNLPFLKVIIHMLGFVVLLLAYAYMLLFDYNDSGITYTDLFIIVWIASFFVDEMKQVIIAIIRKKWKSYTSDWWNRFDWMIIIGYTFGMILRTGEGPGFRITSKCLLLFAFTLLCIRVLNFCCMTSFLGPKLVIIRKMIKDTVAFMIIMAVIMIWYSVSYYALLYPNSEFTWKQIGHILSNGYWILFGELNLDGDTLSEPDCTFNMTLYESSVLQRCPDKFGLYLTSYLKAFYGLIAVVLLLNLLIAIYSDTYAEVQNNSKVYWSEMQMCFLEEYSIKTVFPVHLQLLALPGIIVAIIAAVRFYLHTSNTNDGKKIEYNEHPMCVRAFLYDTNYDMRLECTENAEEEGAQEAIGKIDIDNFDEITKENDSNSIKQDMQTEKDHSRPQKENAFHRAIAEMQMQKKKDDKLAQEIEHRLKSIERNLNDLVENKMYQENITTISGSDSSTDSSLQDDSES